MKKLTLNETWEQCLAMWKWISRRCLNSLKDVNDLKKEWLKVNGFTRIHHDCFFCHKCPRSTHNAEHCGCPAKKIDKKFDCFNYDYGYREQPRKFYAKLKELNKIRLAKK